jgi:hypothetical protein
VHISANQTVFVDAHHGFGGVTCEGADPVQGKVTILKPQFLAQTLLQLASQGTLCGIVSFPNLVCRQPEESPSMRF